MAPASNEPNDPFELVGTILERKVRIDRAVAEGGFGVVYLGHHLSLDCRVAVKVLRPTTSQPDPDAWADAMERFVLEAQAIAKVRHPAVVRIMDSGIAAPSSAPQGVPWMVLEWIEGETLREHLHARRALQSPAMGRSRRETLELLRPVLEAIAEAHEVGLVHRDLKPSNVMLERGGAARVLDFGTAKLLGDEPIVPSGETTTAESMRAFSAVSAAPEQLAGTRTGPWTDVYSLALMVTEVTCDRAPYPEDDPAARYAAAFDAHHRPTPRKFGIDCGAWESVLERALAVRPSERQENARALLTALERFVDDDASPPFSSLAAPATADITQKGGPSSRMGVARKTLWAVGAAALLGGAGAGRLYQVRSNAQRTAIAQGNEAAVEDAAVRPSLAVVVDASDSLALMPNCASDRECRDTRAIKDAVCNQTRHRCVALSSPDCEVLADDRALAASDAVWFGALFPKTGPDAAEYGLGNVHAIDLARRDFVETMSGVASQRSGDAARPFGVVACDDVVDAKRAAQHLVDVGAPAVIGFRNGVEAMELASSVFMPNDILSMCATSTNPMVTRLPNPPDAPRLMFRTTYNASATAAALAAFVESRLDTLPGQSSSKTLTAKEVRARDAGASGNARPSMAGASGEGHVAGPRVALVRPKSAMGAALADEVARGLEFRADHYRDLSFESDASDVGAQYQRIAQELLSFKPQAVIFSGGKAAVDTVIGTVERKWRPGDPKPLWASIAIIGSNLTDLVDNDRELGRRVFGVGPVSSSPANARFVAHYTEVFPEEHVTVTDGPNTAYDAFYLLAYATYASSSSSSRSTASAPVAYPRPTGSDLARAMARLQPANPRVEAGLSGIFDAYRTLSSGGGIDFTGATGPLDFDLSTGDAPFDQAILCTAFDAKGRASTGKESGLVWSAADRKLVGEFSCK